MELEAYEPVEKMDVAVGYWWYKGRKMVADNSDLICENRSLLCG